MGGIMVRRWVVLLLGLALTAGVAGLAYGAMPPRYQATARMMLLLPDDARREPGNPFLYSPNGLVVLAHYAAEILYTQSLARDIEEAGLVNSFEAGLEPREPIITVSVQGDDADRVAATRDYLVHRVEEKVLIAQTEVGAPPRHIAYVHTFMDHDLPYEIGGDRTRALVGVVAAGVLLSLVAAFAVGRRRSTTTAAGSSRPAEDSLDGERDLLPAWGFVALYAVLLLCIPTRLIVGPIGAPGAPANLLAIAGLLWWVCELAGGRLRRFSVTPFRVAILGFTAMCFGSYAAGHLQGWYQPADIRPRYGARLWRVAEVPEMTEVLGSGADRGLLALAGWIGIALLAAEGIRCWDQLHKVVNWLVGAGTVVALIGVIQYFTNMNLAQFINIPGLSAQGAFGHAISRSDLNRVVATSTHPIEMAVVMAALLPLALHVGFFSKRLIGWLPTLLIGVSTLMTVSRSGIVVAAVAMLVLFIGWDNRRRLLPILAAPAIVVVGPIVLPGLLGTIRSLFTNLGDDPSITGRTDDYELVARLVAEQPLFGRGLFTFVPMVYRTIDNQMLVLLLELGILGTLAFLVLVLVAFNRGIVTHRRAETDQQRHLGLALAASLLSIVSSYLTFDAMGFRQVAGLTFLFIGLCSAAFAMTRPEATTKGEKKWAEPQTSTA